MKTKALILASILAMTSTSNAIASAKPTDPKKQTPWNLYVDSKEAYELKIKMGKKALLVDVRDPGEIQFTGFTDIADINIPYMMMNKNKWNSKKSIMQMEKNPDFISEIEKTLSNKDLTKNDSVIIMCRSGGTRGAPAANMLFDKGFKKVYVVTDGFEGGGLKKGDKKGWRLKNGWKNSGLPWSYKLNKEKMYFKNNF
jgi:rhodanese-related sulfurtransferase